MSCIRFVVLLIMTTNFTYGISLDLNFEFSLTLYLRKSFQRKKNWTLLVLCFFVVEKRLATHQGGEWDSITNIDNKRREEFVQREKIIIFYPLQLRNKKKVGPKWAADPEFCKRLLIFSGEGFRRVAILLHKNVGSTCLVRTLVCVRFIVDHPLLLSCVLVQ